MFAVVCSKMEKGCGRYDPSLVIARDRFVCKIKHRSQRVETVIDQRGSVAGARTKTSILYARDLGTLLSLNRALMASSRLSLMFTNSGDLG